MDCVGIGYITYGGLWYKGATTAIHLATTFMVAEESQSAMNGGMISNHFSIGRWQMDT
jgi:hypothetical protein